MKRPLLLRATLSFPLLLGPACVGSIENVGGNGRPGAPASGQPSQPGLPNDPTSPPSMVGNPTMPGKPGDLPGATDPVDPNAVGPMPLRRLSRREYNNTVRDLLGETSRPADAFPPDRDDDFSFRRAGLVAMVDATRIGGAAEALAQSAEARFATLVPCAPAAAADEEPCARKFIEGFGLRAYRRPLNGAEIDRHLALYRKARGEAGLDFKGGIKLLIEAMLQSPNFIYRWEIDGPAERADDGKNARLGPYQVASRLSYAIWGSMPDEPLFAAAAAGKLATDADIEAQALRMLGSDKAKETITTFFDELFGFDDLADRPKDAKVYPEWKEELQAAMRAEWKTFVDHVVWQGDGKLDTLLTAGFSFVNQPLAAIYGMPAGAATGPEMKRADLDPRQRAGLLTLSGWLTLTGATDGSHPVQRGKTVFEKLLCGHLPPPPPDVPPPKTPDSGLTTRERFAEHGQEACAVNCHQHIDPLGFAFEHYDGLGKYRTTDAGKPVDASGKVKLDGADKSFANATELVRHLAGSAEARACFVTQMSRFAWSRTETKDDRASLAATAGAFEQGHNLKDLMVAIAKSRSFRNRAPGTDEVLR